MAAIKRLSSGKYVDLQNLSSDDVDIYDINMALNELKRFNGHYKDEEPLTVAQHTWLCCKLADKFFPNDVSTYIDCLIHDMPEAYYGDIATPIKHALGDALREFTQKIDAAVYNKLYPLDRIGYDQETYTRRKICDLWSLDIERRTMWNSQVGKDKWPQEEADISLKEKKDLFYEAKLRGKINLEGMYREVLERI